VSHRRHRYHQGHGRGNGTVGNGKRGDGRQGERPGADPERDDEAVLNRQATCPGQVRGEDRGDDRHPERAAEVSIAPTTCVGFEPSRRSSRLAMNAAATVVAAAAAGTRPRLLCTSPHPASRATCPAACEASCGIFPHRTSHATPPAPREVRCGTPRPGGVDRARSRSSPEPAEPQRRGSSHPHPPLWPRARRRGGEPRAYRALDHRSDAE
jgi:hypothetical protein